MLNTLLKIMQQSKMKALGLSLSFITGLSLYGCDAGKNPSTQASTEQTQTETSPDITPLKSGNMLYIIRDVADMQLKTGDYLTQLKEGQATLQQAITSKDQTLLKQSVTSITSQLNALNSSLNGLNLKSQEVDNIRQQVLQVSEKALAMPLFNGQTDLSKIDFNKVEQQLGSIQADMLQLAALVISSPDADTRNSEPTNKTEKEG